MLSADDTICVKEAAEMLKIHPEKLRDKARRGEIPAYKPFGNWLFSRSELAEFIKKYKNVDRQRVRHLQEELTECREALFQSTPVTARINTHSLRQTAKEYADLLGLGTNDKQKN